ncbi:hypothetical protein RhiirA4_470824 [Rhizophagus irregularis]|uniref:Uncharacterized protein n=1 Tax=Rhizophagus irregularis TaxID=588596 RepID=A0A2I1H200_9GLOM|nr:hypothetical protein RhiirA4_470824 [Rhizophagus irregularis]
MQSLDRFDLFTPISNDNSYNHPIYLIIHQLIPQDLYNLLRSFTFNDKLTRKIIWEFLLSFHEHIYQQIWPKHCSFLRAWERRHGITSKRKRNTRRNRKSTKTRSKLTRSRAAQITSVQPQDSSSSHSRRNNSPSDGTTSRAHHPWSLALIYSSKYFLSTTYVVDPVYL